MPDERTPANSLLDPEQYQLHRDWRKLGWAATAVALISAPVFFLYLLEVTHLGVVFAAIGTIVGVLSFRGLVEVLTRRFLPSPMLYGADKDLQEEDVVARRRVWWWRKKFRRLTWLVLSLFLALVLLNLLLRVMGHPTSLSHTIPVVSQLLAAVLPQLLILFLQLPFFLLFNFMIFLGPMLYMAVSQIRVFEPGDADWGVKLEDVRGQKEAKEEIEKVIRLWQSGEAFELAGGKRERGLMFLGAPGVGKTMLSKAIATNFQCPFITIPGSGFAQAQPLDAKVLTPTGWRRMGDLAVGDEVLNPEGGRSRISGVYPQGRRQVYRVTFSDGSTTECDRDHLWQVRRHGRANWTVKPLHALIGPLAKLSRQSRPFIPMVTQIDFAEQELPLDPYLLGALIGDGSFTSQTVYFTSHDQEIIDEISERLPNGISVNALPEKVGQFSLTQGMRGKTRSPLIAALKDLGLMGHGAADKFLPDAYKYSSQQTRLEVLRGLMDTDGCATKGQAQFGTCSPRLAEDVQFLVRSLGGTARICRKPAGHYRHPDGDLRPSKPYYTMNIGLSPDHNPFKLPRKASIWARQWGTSRRVVAIEKTERKEVQCIKLDSANQLYVTDDFIVTHNTFVGMDVITVMALIGRARRAARKWGGQAIIFIDEIDAVGTRRSSLGAGASDRPSFEDLAFFGRWGSLTPSEDLFLETRAWRERLFTSRQPQSESIHGRIANAIQRIMPGGMFGGGGMALNQLLVQMDGVDNPPLIKRALVKRLNTFLDAMFIVPRRIGKLRLRLRPARPRKVQVFFIGATNVPLEVLDPALVRPGRMGRHIWFRTPNKDDRKDVFDLYISKVAHDEALDTDEKREELARMTNGYSPAMIDQVCSMALTYAHADGRPVFEWKDLVEAMTTVESGTAVAIDYVPEETRAVAIHEAGHAVAAHLYMDDVLSTRLSIRKRGASLGHHQAIETQERFSSWRDEEFAKLVWTLGAMAAERVFYGQTSAGVGGDVLSATTRAVWMVGTCAMGPAPTASKKGSLPSRKRQELGGSQNEVSARFREIGETIINRSSGGSMFDSNPIAGVLADPAKRRAACELLGQAYYVAHRTIAENKDAVEQIAERLIEVREIYGNEVVDLLDSFNLKRPKIDFSKIKGLPDAV